MIVIVEFKAEYATDFMRLNIAWLNKYFYVEEIDKMMLSDPFQHIISKGGLIFFAKDETTIAGTFALLKISDREYELAKMAVDEQFQGKKIGNRMLEYAIAKAKDLNAKKLSLYSNTVLEQAIHLYKKYGFTERSMEHSEYARSNIKMELDL